VVVGLLKWLLFSDYGHDDKHLWLSLIENMSAEYLNALNHAANRSGMPVNTLLFKLVC
jgi:hypothetical protein